MEKIQELTEKIYREGVEKGQAEADRIVEEAKHTAEQIIAEAREQAKGIEAQAQKKAGELDANTKSELKLYTSQALNALKNRVFTPDPDNHFLPELILSWKENRQAHSAYLLAELLSCAVDSITAEPVDLGGRFAEIVDFIQKNCCGTLSVKNIAAKFDVSQQSIRRIFRSNITGLTPGGLVRQQRMILAEEMLQRTDLTLAEIAKKCGFANAFSFSRAFHREYEIPPSVYRKQQIK